jgi:YD repeat-containing protein
MGWTRTTLDKAGRPTAVTSYSGATTPAPWGSNSSTTGSVTATYGTDVTYGAYTQVSDQASKSRRSLTDGLGRLVRVDEPDASNNLGAITAPTQATSYSYDPLSNLTQVTQGVQTRTFNYSSLSRLTSATNPEIGASGNGTLTYLYDNNGNLTQKTDPRATTTTFAYDNLKPGHQQELHLGRRHRRHAECQLCLWNGIGALWQSQQRPAVLGQLQYFDDDF